MDFRTRLREQIDYLGLTDKEVAAKAGITKRSLDTYVGARACMPAADIAVKLANVLGVSVEWLITGNQNTAQNPEVQELISNYSKLSNHDKKLLLQIIYDMNNIEK